MEKTRKSNAAGERARSASSLSALEVEDLVRTVRRTGYALSRLHQLVMTRALAMDDELELAEQLNDELKPLIDGLLHFSLPGRPVNGL